MGSATVVIVDDAEVLVRGLAAFVQDAVPGCTIIRVSNGPAAADQDADLVVCGPSALRSWCGYLSDETTTIPTLAVIADPRGVDFTSVLSAGVEAIWDYRGNQGSFARALNAALAGQAWVSDSLTSAMTSDLGVQLRRGLQAADYGLTPRENEILQLMATGCSNRDIAVRLFISHNTVKNHVRAVLDKLHAGTRTEAVMVGARMGLIDLQSGRL